MGMQGEGELIFFDDVAESPPAPESHFDRSPKNPKRDKKRKEKKVAVACVLPVTLMKACAIPPPLP